MFRIRYNAPVILTFSIAAVLITLLSSTVWRGLATGYFAVDNVMDWTSLSEWFRLFSHVLGHASWQQLTANLGFILLLGPLLESRYGSPTVLFMVLITAVVSGLLHVAFGFELLMGASGVAFMLIVLASLAEFRAREIPLTFVLVAAIFLWREMAFAFGDDNVTSVASLFGGAIGAVAGFVATRKRLPLGPVFK